MCPKFSQKENLSNAVEKELNATLLRDVRERERIQKNDPSEKEAGEENRVTSE